MPFPHHVGLLHPVRDPVRLPWPQGGAGKEVRDKEGAEEGGHEGEEEEHFCWVLVLVLLSILVQAMALDYGSDRMFLDYSVGLVAARRSINVSGMYYKLVFLLLLLLLQRKRVRC